MEAKWGTVLEMCLADPIFKDWLQNPPRWEALETAFNRWTKETLRAVGISDISANLSGLPEDMSPFVSLIVTMAEDKEASNKSRKDKKEKELRNDEWPKRKRRTKCSMLRI